MNHPYVLPGLVALAIASVAACTSNNDAADPDGAGASGGADSASSSGAPGSAGAAEPAGGSDGAGDAGSPGMVGAGGADALPSADALPAGTFLYVRSLTEDHDELVARDFATGDERVVTDLTGDGSEGWEIWGHDVSPDRKRIAVASLYDPTQEDIDTDLATRRIWTMATDGSDMRRLTPVFENTGAGRKLFSIDVAGPSFTADGSAVIYEFGNWWYEGTTLEGGSLPWIVAASGDELPSSFPTLNSCTVVNPSVNPATGEVLLVHSVCISSADEGIFLYPSDGGTDPTPLVPRGFGAGQVDPSLETASWVADGSGFVFVGAFEVTRDVNPEQVVGLLAYDTTTNEVAVLVIPEPDTQVQAATVSADASSIVYCLRHDDLHDLHAIDLTQDPPLDVPITDDGISCDPAF